MARVMPWITGVSLISMIWSGVWRDASFVAMLSIASTVVAVLLESCSPSCAQRADTDSRVYFFGQALERFSRFLGSLFERLACRNGKFLYLTCQSIACVAKCFPSLHPEYRH